MTSTGAARLTPEMADKLGWTVAEHAIPVGKRWFAIPHRYPNGQPVPCSTLPAKSYASAADALGEVERRVAFQLGITVDEFRLHLDRVTAAAKE